MILAKQYNKKKEHRKHEPKTLEKINEFQPKCDRVTTHFQVCICEQYKHANNHPMMYLLGKDPKHQSFLKCVF